MDKIVSSITFCKRLGKLVLGFDVVKKAILKDEAFLVVLANDLSEKTLKEVHFMCDNFEVPYRTVDITLDEFWYLVGKRAGVIAISDEGFAKKLIALID